MHFQSAYWRGSGVAISNVTFRDVYARDLALPFLIAVGQPEATAQIEDIVIDGFHAEVFAGGGIAGNANTRPRRIRLRDIDLAVVSHPGQLGSPRDKPSHTLLDLRSADDVLKARRAARLTSCGVVQPHARHAHEALVEHCECIW